MPEGYRPEHELKKKTIDAVATEAIGQMINNDIETIGAAVIRALDIVGVKREDHEYTQYRRAAILEVKKRLPQETKTDHFSLRTLLHMIREAKRLEHVRRDFARDVDDEPYVDDKSDRP